MNENREDIRVRIVERLDQLDDETLQRLDGLLAHERLTLQPADGNELEPRLLSRRQLLAGLLAGGVVVGGTNLTTAWYAREQGVAVGRQMGADAARTQVVAESAPAQEKMQAEIDALRGLVSHYEALEGIDLDQAVAQSIEQFESSVAGLRHLSQGLVHGIDTVRAAIDRFEVAVPTIRQGIAHVDDTLDSLDERLEALRQILADILERAAPVTDSLNEFFDAVLARIPFGIGERIELVVERLRRLIEAVPITISAVRERLLSPLQTAWFADADDQGVQGGLLAPIRTQLLDPAEQLLSGLDDVADNWQREVAEPANRALAQRTALRQALAEYKSRHQL